MFGIGFAEVVVILLVMIIFIRPEDLPKTLRTMGRFYGKFKSMYKEVVDTKDQIMREIDEVTSFDETPPKPPSVIAPKPLPNTTPEPPALSESPAADSSDVIDSNDVKKSNESD